MAELLSPVPAALHGWLQATLLLSLRIGATFAMTPVFHSASLPATMRLLLVLGLSVALAGGLASPLPAFMHSGEFVAAALSELALGATLGLGVLLAFGAFRTAGQLLDVQLGFGMAQMLDPVTQRPIPILTSAFEALAVLVFFLVDGHHALLRGIRYSVECFPIGASWPLSSWTAPMLHQVAGLFTLGFALAAPVVFCVLLVEAALGVIGRNLPQMNTFAVGASLKIAVGLVALSLWAPALGGLMTRSYAGIVDAWDAAFAATPPRTRTPGR